MIKDCLELSVANIFFNCNTRAIGLAGIFIEVHPEPSQAKCDGPSATKLDELEAFLSKINAVDDVVKSF